MTGYIARRILLMFPTLLGILSVSFVVVQFAPGGPVERVLAQLSGADTGGTSRVSGGGGDFGPRGQVGASADAVSSKYRGAQGLDPDFIKKLEAQFGFDKPAPERFAPLVSMALGAFATMALLTKNSFLDEIRKQYVMTARAKGCSQRQVLYNHIFRNAMLIVIAGFPSAFIHAFFSGSLLIETIFSLDGLGLLGFESVLNRDYPVVSATLYIMSLVGLLVNLISDLTYTWVDPRIDFETREV